MLVQIKNDYFVINVKNEKNNNALKQTCLTRNRQETFCYNELKHV